MIDTFFQFIIFQTVITQINHAIGASGVISQECKTVVDQYGKTILEMLLSEVYNDTFFQTSFSFMEKLLLVYCTG